MKQDRRRDGENGNRILLFSSRPDPARSIAGLDSRDLDAVSCKKANNNDNNNDNAGCVLLLGFTLQVKLTQNDLNEFTSLVSFAELHQAKANTNAAESIEDRLGSGQPMSVICSMLSIEFVFLSKFQELLIISARNRERNGFGQLELNDADIGSIQSPIRERET